MYLIKFSKYLILVAFIITYKNVYCCKKDTNMILLYFTKENINHINIRFIIKDDTIKRTAEISFGIGASLENVKSYYYVHKGIAEGIFHNNFEVTFYTNNFPIFRPKGYVEDIHCNFKITKDTLVNMSFSYIRSKGVEIEQSVNVNSWKAPQGLSIFAFDKTTTFTIMLSPTRACRLVRGCSEIIMNRQNNTVFQPSPIYSIYCGSMNFKIQKKVAYLID